MSSGALERDLTASGVRLRLAELGNGPPIVLLHGPFVDHSCWDGLLSGLAETHHVIAPDLPGCGNSEKPSASRFGYGVSAFAEAITDLYGGLALGPAVLIGHSLGGAVALTVAARHPELVSRLVLLDSLCYGSSASAFGRLAVLPVLGGLALKQLWGLRLFRAHFRGTLLGPSAQVDPARIERYYASFNEPAARASALAMLRATTDTRDIAAQTTRVQTPTLVLWGRSDRVWPASFGQRLSREIHGARFELLDAGHSPHEEAPAEVLRVIRRFLSDEARARR
jgi:pimeloyl-ACP methyl ester carboxylesterase